MVPSVLADKKSLGKPSGIMSMKPKNKTKSFSQTEGNSQLWFDTQQTDVGPQGFLAVSLDFLDLVQV